MRRSLRWPSYGLIASSLLSGCQSAPLSLHTEYVDRTELASYHVQTPDPKLCCPDIGQRLLLSWRLPFRWLQLEEPPYCLVTIRFYRGGEEEHRFVIDKERGDRWLSLLNNAYIETGGMATFKAELWHGTTLLHSWHHQLWNETIRPEVDPDNSKDKGATRATLL